MKKNRANGSPQSQSIQLARWLSGCNGPSSGNAWWCCPQRIPQQSAGSRPAPPGDLVPGQPLDWQQPGGSRIIEAQMPAREVIPQPRLQPNAPQENRRCRQFAPLVRAPRKPFLKNACIFIAAAHEEKRWSDKSKPHCVVLHPAQLHHFGQ